MKRTEYTYDQLTVRHLVHGEPRALPRIVRQSEQALGLRCPECDGTDVEDNGASEYRCNQCDHRWGFENGDRYGF